jgi:hypothetical protein
MKKFVRRYCWWLLVCVSGSVCVGSAFLLASADRREGPFWEKYQKVKMGMTEEEVEGILGPGLDLWGDKGPTNVGKVYSWREGDQEIRVQFDFSRQAPHGPPLAWGVRWKHYFPGGWAVRFRRNLERFKPEPR